MRVFDRELDGLEETIVYLALVFFVCTILVVLFGRAIPIIAFFAGLGGSLSLVAGFVAIPLWILGRLGSPVYSRWRGPERSALRSLHIDRTRLTKSTQD